MIYVGGWMLDDDDKSRTLIGLCICTVVADMMVKTFQGCICICWVGM